VLRGTYYYNKLVPPSPKAFFCWLEKRKSTNFFWYKLYFFWLRAVLRLIGTNEFRKRWWESAAVFFFKPKHWR